MPRFRSKKHEQQVLRHSTSPPVPRSRPTAQPAPGSQPPAAGGWGDIDTVRAEWPQSRLDPEADLHAWQEGMHLYEGSDDYQPMMRCVITLSAALAHSLYGDGILRGKDLPETVHRVLYSALSAPPDRQTFAEDAQRAARLALTVIRENGWQPASMGGQGLFDKLIMDTGNYMLLCAAIGPGGLPGDLKAFFNVPPQPAVTRIPDARSQAAKDQLHDMASRAEAGDEAGVLHTRGLGAWMNGDTAGALQLLEQAARLGYAQAMKDAGDLCSELGKDSEARIWFESAAKAGNPQAIYNMGALAIGTGDRQTAANWFQRAAEAGNANGFAALTQLADEAGDQQAERHWARLGAEAGQAFCMFRHGMHLTLEADGDTPTLRRANAYLEAAAEREDIDAMLMAGNVNSQLGNDERARSWYDRARATGDPKALRMLEKYGL